MVQELVFDGNTSFVGGQDASKIPDKVPEDGYFAGVNTTTQQGDLGPRWALNKLNLNFIGDGIKLASGHIKPLKDIFHSGRFQLVAPYSVGQEFYLVIVISGVIFLFNQRTNDVSQITIKKGSSLNSAATRLNWSPAGKFLVIFDFPAYPVIIENFEARRADPKEFEVPISTQGAYNQNRLFIANAGNEFTGGDPAGNLATPEAPVTFEEVEKPAAPFFGQIFQLSTNYGNDPITAMAFLQFSDTSTGIGPLLVATQNAIYSYNTQQPRVSWQNGQFGTIFTFNNGIAGPRAFTNVNSDLFFLSNDGQVRSASMSRDEQHKWSKVPLSKEVQNWLVYPDPSLMEFTSLTYFKNKIFILAKPYRVDARDINSAPIIDIAFGGFAVLELDNISTLGQDSTPAWAGLWTGVRPMDTAINNNRFFVISKDTGFTNEIYEFDPLGTVDTIDGIERDIVSQVYSRQYVFQNPFQNKEIHSIDIAINNIEGDFDLIVEYKPSHSSKYLAWTNFSHKAPWRTCKIPTDIQLQGFAPQQFKDLIFGVPENQECNPVTQELYRFFRKLQVKLTLQGHKWALQEFKLKAIVMPQSELLNICGPFPIVEFFQQCDTNWVIPEINLCQKKVT